MKNILKCRAACILFAAVMMFLNMPFAAFAQKTARDFQLKSLDNTSVTLSSFKGSKNVLLLFWTTWCPYCRDQLIESSNKNAEYRKNDIELLAINIGETTSKVEKFLKSKNLTLKVLMDGDSRVAEAFKVMGIPTYVLVNKKGEIVYSGHSFPDSKIDELTR